MLPPSLNWPPRHPSFMASAISGMCSGVNCVPSLASSPSTLLWPASVRYQFSLVSSMDIESGRYLPITGLIMGALTGIFVIYPLFLTILELCLLVFVCGKEPVHRQGLLPDVVTVSLGIFYSLLYLSVIRSVQYSSDWTETLINEQRHTPVSTQALLTVLALGAVGTVGYLAVNCISLEKIPPLLLVLGMSAMYLGTFESMVWGLQVYQEPLDLCLLLLPLNCVLVTARTVIAKVLEWKTLPPRISPAGQDSLPGWCSRILDNSTLWPLTAFLLMWPLLGMIICLLLLLGQAPDAFIRAWTDTSDWSLSQQTAPQNLHFDEHYLCTVAAGGHRKVVKPLRMGLRHGHKVIVNRQLCIANAFEQVLEERTPRFHRAVRNFYDTYGFPVAKLIRSRYAADLVYLLMKPLEWFFLAVLYLTDARPENRIALQYLPLPPKETGADRL